MSTTDLKQFVDERTSEERQWLAAYLLELERQPDSAALAEFDRRMDEMDAGKNRVGWDECRQRLDQLERTGQ